MASACGLAILDAGGEITKGRLIKEVVLGDGTDGLSVELGTYATCCLIGLRLELETSAGFEGVWKGIMGGVKYSCGISGLVVEVDVTSVLVDLIGSSVLPAEIDGVVLISGLPDVVFATPDDFPAEKDGVSIGMLVGM